MARQRSDLPMVVVEEQESISAPAPIQREGNGALVAPAAASGNGHAQMVATTAFDELPEPLRSLLQRLHAAPYDYDFFQALRLLECCDATVPRWGRSQRPSAELLRLGQQPHLSFAPSTLASLHPPQKGRPPLLLSYFLGLYGPQGPLPSHLTEYVYERIVHRHDDTLARFSDLFHHRVLALFYRAWADPQPTVNYDRPDDDRFAKHLGALIGLGEASLRQRDALPDNVKLHFAGHLARHARNPAGLTAMIAGYFRLPVQLEEFVPHWLRLPLDAQCRLGDSPETGCLGESVVIGSRVWQCQHQFRLILGPLSLADYQRLLPGGDSLRALVALVRGYVGDELFWDLQLILRQRDVPPARLGQSTQLGWTSWLAASGLDRDGDELYLNAMAYESGQRRPADNNAGAVGRAAG